MDKYAKQDKRIVFFDATLQSGGAERVISILTNHLLTSGYQVEVLLYHDQPIFYTMPTGLKITIVERETGSSNIHKNICWMRQFFKQNANIVISFLAPFNMLALVSHLGLKSKIIVADRNDPRYVPANPILRGLRNILYSMANGVVLQTQHNKSYFSKRIQSKSVVIYNPVDLKEKRGQALRTPKRDKIVCVGRLMPQKNQSMLIRAFALIQPQFPTYKLVFYGDGPQRSILEQKAAQLGIADKVVFAGNIKNVFDKISDAKLFVLSSNYEGMPNALIEAMCLGLPVISTDVSGTEELIENGKSGFIVSRKSPEKLAEAMRQVLSDEMLQKQFAYQAEKLNDKLQVSVIVNQWVNFITKMENK